MIQDTIEIGQKCYTVPWAREHVNERCERMSERTSKWSNTNVLISRGSGTKCNDAFTVTPLSLMVHIAISQNNVWLLQIYVLSQRFYAIAISHQIKMCSVRVYVSTDCSPPCIQNFSENVITKHWRNLNVYTAHYNSSLMGWNVQDKLFPSAV